MFLGEKAGYGASSVLEKIKVANYYFRNVEYLSDKLTFQENFVNYDEVTKYYCFEVVSFSFVQREVGLNL